MHGLFELGQQEVILGLLRDLPHAGKVGRRIGHTRLGTIDLAQGKEGIGVTLWLLLLSRTFGIGLGLGIITQLKVDRGQI